jgi:hypothetical protein
MEQEAAAGVGLERGQKRKHSGESEDEEVPTSKQTASVQEASAAKMAEAEDASVRLTTLDANLPGHMHEL